MQGKLVESISQKKSIRLLFNTTKRLLLLTVLGIGLTACSGGDGGLPSAAPPDTTGPVVMSIDPALNESDVSLVGIRINVKFDEELELQSFFKSNVIIQELDSIGNVIPLTEVALDETRPFIYRKNTNTLVIRPSIDSLLERKKYQIVLLEFEDKEGNPMAVFKSIFSTSTPPKVTKINPLDGSMPVSRAEGITVEFDEVMDEASLKNGFELIETLPNSKTSTTYKFSNTKSPLKLNHRIVNNKSIATYTMLDPNSQTSKLLAKTTTYTVSLSSTATEIVTDLKGNPLEPLSVSFSTGVSDKTGTAPAAPGTVKAISEPMPVPISNNTVGYQNSVTWSVNSSKAYNIYVSINGGSFTQVTTTASPLTKSPFIHEAVNLGTKYIYAVSAMNITGSGQNKDYGPESEFSFSNSVTPRAAVASIKVTAVAGPAASNVTDGAVEVKWNTTNGGQYYIYVSKAGSAFTKLVQNPVTATGAQLVYPAAAAKNTYKPGNDVFYKYGITLIDPKTKIESAMVSSNRVIPFAAPRNVTAVAGNKRVTVKWNTWKNVPGVSYSVFAKTGAGAFTRVATGLTTGLYVHGSATPLLNGTSYRYQVIAISKVGTVTRTSLRSPATAAVIPKVPATPPAAPANFAAVAGNANVTLTWTIATGANFNYRIYQKQGAGNYTLIKTLVKPTTGRYVVTGLSNVNYTFQISAVNTNVEGAKATSAVVKPTVTVVSTEISAWNHSCVIKAGTLWCWGDNSYGQVGNGSKSRTQKSVRVPDPTVGNRIGTSWVAVATGERHSCGIRNTGEMYCWGYAGHGQLGNGSTTSPVTPRLVLVSKPTVLGTAAVNWTKVTAGQYYTCGLHSTAAGGQLFCWGDDSNDQLGLVTTTAVTVPTAVQTGLDSNNNWIDIVASSRHTCGLRKQAGKSTIWCWGVRRSGQLGDNNQADTTTLTFSVPTQVAVVTTGATPDTDWSSVALGQYHTCGVRSSTGTLWCWGSNLDGQLGNGRSTSYAALQELSGATNWLKVYAKNSQTCGLKKSGAISCWGKNASGETGNGRVSLSENSPTTFIGATDWSKLALGMDYTCGIHNASSAAANGVSCWGSAEQFGVGAFTSESAIPVQVGTAANWLDVTFGIENDKEFTLGFKGTKTSNTLFGFGLNHYGVFGNNNKGLIKEQFPVSEVTPNGGAWKAISGGYHHACGIKTNNGLYCWGRGAYLGQSSRSIAVPTRVGGTADTWLTVDVGARHSCGIKTDNSLWCWGDGSNGEFGAGEKSAGIANVPDTANGIYMIQVLNPTAAAISWTKVSAGFRFTCAIDKPGNLYCWGSNSQGQLGLGARSSIPKYIPTLIAKIGTASWLTVSSGFNTTCAITNVGNQNLYCWGDNVFGTIGSATAGTNDQASPTVVTDNNTVPWSDVSLNGYHACARKADSQNGLISEGSLWCWGKSDYGQIGNDKYNINFTPSQNFPSKVSPGSFWKKFATGNDTTCAVKAVDNTLWCWGKNFGGQLGMNNAWSTTALPVILP